MEERLINKVEEIRKKAKSEAVIYFKEYSNNMKIDSTRLKDFLLVYNLKLELPSVNDDDIDYLIKIYANGSNNLDFEQFVDLLETLILCNANELEREHLWKG